MNKTSLDWFLENLPERFKNVIHNTCQEEIQKARELGKTQITDAWDSGHYYASYGHNTEIELDAERYYSQTYKKDI